MVPIRLPANFFIDGGDNNFDAKRPQTPAKLTRPTAAPATDGVGTTTVSRESVLDINSREKKEQFYAGDDNTHEKRAAPATRIPTTRTTAHRESVLGVERNRRDSFDEHFSDDSPTGGAAWSTSKKKKKKKKLPRFRSDGSANRPMQKIIQLHCKRITTYFSARANIDGDDDDSSSNFSAEPRLEPVATVIVNSLSTWRQEKYHGDGRVPIGGKLYDNGNYCSGDGGGDQHYDDDGTHYDGD